MAYAKIDDLYDDKRKIRRAWRAHAANPVGLHIMAITYCQRHRLDGRIPTDWIEEMLPTSRVRQAILATMVDTQLFDLEADGSYCIHDFLDWNESATERRARSDAARNAVRTRWRNTERNADRNTTTE